MIIAGSKYGQLANRLFLLGHLIATSKENQVKLVFPYFQEYKEFFSHINEYQNLSLNFHDNRILNFFYRLAFSFSSLFTSYFFRISYWHEIMISKMNEIDLSDPNIKSKFQKKLVILNGWKIRNRVGFTKYAEEIKRLFAPHDRQSNIDRFICDVRSQYDFLVGVHIRLGDYKNWQGGKYYYPFSFYAQKCKELLIKLRQEERKVVFVLCSDQKIDSTYFKDIPFVISTGHIIEDLYILSRCNIIFGPPSSYSMWASFYGNVPLMHIQHKKEVLLLDKFKVHSEINA